MIGTGKQDPGTAPQARGTGPAMDAAAAADLDGRIWRKSSWSAYNGNCVAIARLRAGQVGVRDTKDPAGPVLRFSRASWEVFVERVKSGELDA